MFKPKIYEVNQSLSNHDADGAIKALFEIANEAGITATAEKAGMTRAGVHRMYKGGGRLDTFVRVLGALGYRVVVEKGDA